MLNRCEFIGNLGRDVEVKYTQSNAKIVNLSLGVSETWKDRDGQRQSRTEWVRVVIFNEKLGEIAERFLRKGSRCFIAGQMQTRKWQDQSGQDKYSTEIVLPKFGGQIVLLDSRDDGDRQNARDDRDQRKPSQGAGGYDDLDSDIPF